MIEYIKGILAEVTPTQAVIEAAGVGYEINIALPVYTALAGQADTSQPTEAKLYIEEIIREDTHVLFGFCSKGERELFRLLTSVSGIGANTARMIMSGFTATELRQIIATGNVAALSSIKGLGAKTAQRLIVDLRDKVLKVDLGQGVTADTESESMQPLLPDNETKQEAVSALTMLGFAAAASSKVVDKILKDNPDMSVEEVIRKALKML